MKLYILLYIIICILLYIFLNSPHIEHYTEQPVIRILHLVLYSSSIEYDKMYLLTRDYYKKFNNLITIYYTFSPKYNIITLIDDILYIPGNETYLPGILDKTIKAFLYCDLHYQYDYIVRSNISTIINFNLLFNKLNKINIAYGGGLINQLKWLDIASGINDNKYFGTKYASGTAIVFSNTMMKHFLLKKDKINYDIIDDVSIGILIKEQFPDITPISLDNFLFVSEDIQDINLYINNIIFYRNRCKDRKKDIKHMKHIINKLL